VHESLAELLDERQHLLAVAAWLSGSAGTAEWVVQETYRRWYTLPDAERHAVPLPKAWLTRAVGNIGLELLHTDHAPTPTLPPVVIHLPREAPTPTTPHRRHPHRRRPVHDQVTHRFAKACDTGDRATLATLLAADAVAVCDGGGKVRSPVEPIHGATAVASYVTTLLTNRAGATLTTEPVNGRTGLTIRQGHRAVAVVSVSTTDTEITAVWITLNPDKLHGWHRSP
jgi:RNA polymerase sigma-70 factor (ECF subfamily)